MLDYIHFHIKLIKKIILLIFVFKYLKSFDLSPIFSEEEFKHWFLPQEGIIDAYIVINDNKITGMKLYIYIYI